MMRNILWILSLLGALAGGVSLIGGVTAAQSAPQQAAATAMAVGYAVIPYCLARAWSELSVASVAQVVPQVAPGAVSHTRRNTLIILAVIVAFSIFMLSDTLVQFQRLFGTK